MVMFPIATGNPQMPYDTAPAPFVAPTTDDYDETAACCCCGDRFNTGFLGSDLSMFDFGIRDNCGDLVCEACTSEYVEAQLTDRERPYDGRAVWL